MATNNSLNPLLFWLRKPYHIIQSNKYKILISILMGLLGSFSMIFLSPLDVRELTDDIVTYGVSIGLTITISMLFFYYVFAVVFKHLFNVKKWNNLKQIITVSVMITLISLGVIITNSLSSSEAIRSLDVTSVLEYVFIAGIFPTLIFIFIDGRYGKYERKTLFPELMKRERKLINSENAKLPKSKKIIIRSDKEKLLLNLDSLIYITSESNYASFFSKQEDNDNLKEDVIRLQLHAIEKQLEKYYPQILRCHKSYLVNTSLITKVSGNARGYFLHFDNIDIKIPVSRRFSKKQLESFIKK